VFLIPFALVWAQTPTGQFTGQVTDPSGASVSGAKITVTGLATGLERETQTNDTLVQDVFLDLYKALLAGHPSVSPKLGPSVSCAEKRLNFRPIAWARIGRMKASITLRNPAPLRRAWIWTWRLSASACGSI
jgi:hypothetical protein